MTKSRNKVPGWKLLALVPLVPVLLIVGYSVYLAATAGYAWRERDWNSNGQTTLGEWFYAGGVMTLPLTVDGRLCTEYLDTKSGNSIRIDCPAQG